MVTLKTSRVFDGKKFELRVQPADRMHRGFIDPYTIRYKREAENIAKNRRSRGEEVRIVSVKSEHLTGDKVVGYRIYWRKE
jgi:hypothetical protein